MKKKILIVEDDPMLIEIYKKKFSEDEDFEVFTAGSGVETRKIAAKEEPDLILLDLVLPEEDGFDVLKKIKNKGELSETKIIVFSNLSQEEEKHKAKKLGADDFWVKSEYTPQEAVDKVKAILN